MSDRLCLDFPTAPDLPAADFIHLAADLGLGRVSLLLAPVLGLPDYRLSAPGPERRAAQRALRETGVRLDMAEPFCVAPDTVTADLPPLLDIAAELGARLVNLLARTPDLPRLGQQMGEIRAAARDRGLGIVTEISRTRHIGHAGPDRALYPHPRPANDHRTGCAAFLARGR
ncbi:hypothetical protein PE067_19355 [Paracoccus sp. DMF-8]|uniref:hypothetical protein n=1 Tax=Paracoccus sp. DMF-8 TaxID=3019445 RepID=UPI0023E416CB|nr:hypothetical protein [Paracoccus sp. DMF-8]MDF3608104.1 hypothetical protein [Paracoccus sp. DMF-8]